jgi:AraC-like DNA-binding protein
LYTDYPGAHGEPGFLVSQAYEICALLDLVRHFAGADWKPRELGIIDSEVPPPLMQRFPEASIRVNQPFGFIVISRSCLHKKLCRPHRIDRDDGPLIDTAILDCAEMLALLLEPHLSEGYPNMDFAAELVNTSARTLNRRLLECNTNYQALVDELRLRKAMAMLQSTQMPINEVSWSVGFRQPPNFTRMFRRMTGINPRQFRRFEAQKLH